MKYISLGCDCLIKTLLTELNYIKRKKNGGHTNVFDLTIHHYKSIIYHINTNFEDYLQLKNIELNSENLLYDKKYNTVYVHESPSFAQIKYDLNWYKDEDLSKEFFVNENYLFLKERYDNRIANFIKDVNCDELKVFFHHTQYNEHCAELFYLLEKKFSNIYFVVINTASKKVFPDIVKEKYEFHNVDIEGDWHADYKNKERLKLALYNILSDLHKKLKLG